MGKHVSIRPYEKGEGKYRLELHTAVARELAGELANDTDFNSEGPFDYSEAKEYADMIGFYASRFSSVNRGVARLAELARGREQSNRTARLYAKTQSPRRP